jgi:hypothetical protein
VSTPGANAIAHLNHLGCGHTHYDRLIEANWQSVSPDRLERWDRCASRLWAHDHPGETL